MKNYSKPAIEVLTANIKLDVITASGTGNGSYVDITHGGFADGDIWGGNG